VTVVGHLGHPDHTYTLVYPGGYGGEFLCYWLGQHAGCVSVPITNLSNNRYVINFNNIRLHPRASKSKLFLPGHDMITGAAKNKFVPTSPDRIIGVRTSSSLQKFYFVLFAIKTILYKYSHTTPMRFLTPEQMLGFFSAIYPRTEFYHHEFDAWLLDQPVLDIELFLHERFNIACGAGTSTTSNFNIDLDQLFFGDLLGKTTEYVRVCQYLGIPPDISLLPQLQQYHDRNVDLVSNTCGISAQTLIEMSNEDAWPIILAACRRHSLV
jgi:hypothetical protein